MYNENVEDSYIGIWSMFESHLQDKKSVTQMNNVEDLYRNLTYFSRLL